MRAIALSLLLFLTWPVAALETGSPFPSLQAPRLDAEGLGRVDDHQGKVLYVDIWASWCPPCRIALPILQDLRERYGAQGFEVLGLNVDSDLRAAKMALSRAGTSYPVLHSLPDAELTALGIKTMPTAFLLDRSGRVRLVHEGFHRDDLPELEHQIEQLLEER
ncbi:MAG: TlpA family protein disulfide reductase [Oceanococcaceae bacterium]